MTTNYAQYAYNSELIAERQSRFVSYATPDLSDLVIEDGFDPQIETNLKSTFAVFEGSAWDSIKVETQQDSRPLWVSLIAAIVNLVR